MGINKILVIFLIVAIPFSCVGCTRNEQDEIDVSMNDAEHFLATTEPDGYNDETVESIELQEDPKEIYNQERLYGTWYIDSAVLKSEMYTGTTKDGVAEEDLYDPEDYIGYELEYSQDFFKIGNVVYDHPKYTTFEVTVAEFNEGGRFRNPDLYSLIKQENILLNDVQCDNKAQVKLIQYEISFDEPKKYDKYDFIPMGTQVVLLNDNTMLVGLWGKIMIAYRKE